MLQKNGIQSNIRNKFQKKYYCKTFSLSCEKTTYTNILTATLIWISGTPPVKNPWQQNPVTVQLFCQWLHFTPAITCVNFYLKLLLWNWDHHIQILQQNNLH